MSSELIRKLEIERDKAHAHVVAIETRWDHCRETSESRRVAFIAAEARIAPLIVALEKIGKTDIEAQGFNDPLSLRMVVLDMAQTASAALKEDRNAQ